ncbi:MAG: hypothetical protein IPM17_04050 [Verrucomicrobia bacterium]|nr:hypothetical protein [Verrucomicrobiota bacterium]
MFLLMPLCLALTCPPEFASAAAVPAAEIPAGYRLLYEQNFAAPAALGDFEFSDPAAWRWTAEAGGRPGALELFQQSRYTPRVRSPFNIALLAGREFGDFVLEVDLVQTGREYGHRDMVIVFAAKDPANFYYAHLATKADDHAHNIFLVNDEPRRKIADTTTDGVNWGLEVWHTVRVERRVEAGSIKVFFDDLTTPIMTANDRHFDYGRIGFGSFDDTGKVARIRIWGPDFAPRRAGFFR